MAFVNPLDKFHLPSSSPLQPPSATRSARSGALRPSQYDLHHNKAATTTPVPSSGLLKQSQQQQRLRRRATESVGPVRQRVTRSQSRELDVTRRDGTEDSSVAGRRKAKQNRELVAVMEEAPPSSTKRPRSPEESIPESPEDHNISGTTVLPTDSEPEGDLDALMMVEALPDLQRASAAVLEFFAPSSSSPGSLSEMVKQLQNPKSSQSRRLERLRSNYFTEAKYFGKQTYIEVEQIARALPSVELSPAGSWQADGILFKANCARLALEVLTRPVFIEVETALYDLEGKFPSPFLNELVRENDINTAGKSSLRRATFDLALEIRTQFLKVNLETHRSDDYFNPNALLGQAFFNESLETQPDFDQPHLRGFNLSTFQDEDGNLPSRYEDDVQDRISDIRKFFRDDEELVDFEGLEATFPWEGFLYSVAKWMRMRDDELSRYLRRQPTVDDVREQLEEELSRRSSLDKPQASVEKAKAVDRPSTAVDDSNHPRRELLPAAEIRERRASSRSSFLNVAAVKHLFQREEQLKQKTPERPRPPQRSDLAGFISRHAAREPTPEPSPGPALTQEREIPASPEANLQLFSPDPDRTMVADSQWEDVEAGRQPGFGRLSEVPESDRQETTSPHLSREVLDVIQRHKAGVGKSAVNRHLFIDRQDNALRVSPISENSIVPESAHLGKRKRVDIRAEEDEAEDVFTQDQRQLDFELRRADKPQPVQKRRRLADIDTEDRERGQEERALSLGPIQRTTNGHRTVATASASASALPAGRPLATRPSYPSIQKPQGRRRWTQEENDRLIYLVGKYGVKWARIKREDELWKVDDGGPKLEGRDQVQLKDRARNIALEYYRAGIEPPRNFNQVTIKRVDKERLRRMGIVVSPRHGQQA